jgi:hypothetical protein
MNLSVIPVTTRGGFSSCETRNEIIFSFGDGCKYSEVLLLNSTVSSTNVYFHESHFLKCKQKPKKKKNTNERCVQHFFYYNLK